MGGILDRQGRVGFRVLLCSVYERLWGVRLELKEKGETF